MNMLNKKGFTLVELLAVITILGIISTIAVISIDVMFEESQRVECEAIVSNLETAAKEFASDNRYTGKFYTTYYKMYASELVSEGYFNGNVINPFTNEDVSSTFSNKVDITLHFNTTDKTVSSVSIGQINCDDKTFPN